MCTLQYVVQIFFQIFVKLLNGAIETLSSNCFIEKCSHKNVPFCIFNNINNFGQSRIFKLGKFLK